jgi:hypothetical protein
VRQTGDDGVARRVQALRSLVDEAQRQTLGSSTDFYHNLLLPQVAAAASS